MVAAPGLAVDDANNLWLFFGTGRFYGNTDKTNSESQRLYGIKDSVLSYSCTQGSIDGCKATSLVNVSDVAVCVVCATGTNQVTSTALSGVQKVEGKDPTTTLQGLVQSKNGWFTNLTTTRERSITSPTVLGGIVFYPTYVPQDDLCISAGDGYLYGLFYQTGSAMSTPVLGTSASGSSTMANAKVDIGQGTGMLSVMAVHIGAQGWGTGGAGTGGSGCQSGITGMMQSSAGLTNTICTNPGAVTSRFIAWINLRE
jgi:type IV pilus assembly protein PilY1